VPLDNVPSFQGNLFFIDFGKLLDPKVFLVPLEELAQQLIWVTRGIAFLLLVWTFKARLQTRAPDELWGSVVRSIVLVSILAGATQLIYMVDSGINAILAMPIHATTRDGVQLSDTLGTTPNMIVQRWSLIMGEVKDPAAQAAQAGSQNQGGTSLVPGLNEVLNGVVGAWNFAKNLAWNIIHGIWRGVQLVTMFLVSGMYILQRILLIAGSVYFPIAIGQLGTRTLRSAGLHFIQAYLGLFAWPLGWGVVNLFVLAAISMNPARTNVTVEDLIRSLFLGFPILLAIVLGYFLAPFMIQKVVARGGTAIQAFLGQMFTASVGAGALAAGAGAVLIGKGLGGAGSAALAAARSRSGQPDVGGLGLPPLLPYRSSAASGGGSASPSGGSGAGAGGPGSGQVKNSPASDGGSLVGSMRQRAAAGSGGIGAAILGGAVMAAGVAESVGDMIGEASGEGHSHGAAGLKGHAQKLVGLGYLSGLANSGARPPSSSERARKYLRDE
jgi:hypothetical protein